MDQKLKNYSSGMQVRLAFACATMAEADILLVDEVLAVGDSDFQRKCFDYFKHLKKIKKTVIFVTHDMNAIKEYCDKAILINENKILVSGMPASIAGHYDKLFTADNNVVESESKKRWGNGSLIMKKASVDLRDEKSICVSYVVEALIDTEDIVIGFMIKNSSGEPIMGTNSLIKKHLVPNMKQGDAVRVEWHFDNIFSDGNYYVDPAIVHKNGETIDWLEDSVKFRIKSTEKVPYIVNPVINLSIKNSGNGNG